MGRAATSDGGPDIGSDWRLLIVDDNPVDREMISDLLRERPDWGGSFSFARTGLEGLQISRRDRPDCIILDYRLPDIDGIDFLAALSDDAGLTSVPVVMLTGQGSEEIDVDAMHLGAQDYLEKSGIDRETLQNAVRHAIERHLRERLAREERESALLQERAELHRLLTMISTRLINAPHNEIDAEIEKALATIGRFARVDACQVFRADAGSARLRQTHNWQKPDTRPELRVLDGADIPWTFDRLSAGEALGISDPRDLPPSAARDRTSLQVNGTRSLLIVPLGDAAGQPGVVCFRTVRNRRAWKEDDLALLTMTGEMLSNAFNRRLAETELRNFNETLEMRVAERTKQLRVSEGRARAVVNTAIDAIITFDEQGCIQSFNPAAEPMFGRAAEDIVGKGIDLLLPGLLPATDDAPVDRGGLAGGYHETVGARHDGTRFSAEVTLSTLAANGQRLYTAFVRDVSARKRAEEEHRLFLAATSHDVQNALSSALMYAEIVDESTSLDEPDRERMSRIISITESICGLMTDIVAHSALEHERLHRDVHSLAEIVDDCAADYEARCRRKGLAFHVARPNVTVSLDRPKLARILMNLLSNAVRYTNRGSVELHLRATGAALEIEIRDTGIGIPPEALDRIQEPYYRHDDARRLESLGTGLGLATARRFVEMHGGSLSIASTPNEGTTVRLSLPDAVVPG